MVQSVVEIGGGGTIAASGGVIAVGSAGTLVVPAGVAVASGTTLGVHGVAVGVRSVELLKSDMSDGTGGFAKNRNPEKPMKLEPTPQTNPEKFESVKGRKGKVNKETGEIWEKDMFHKDHYEIYKNRKDYDKGVRSRTVWNDGRSR